MKALETKHYQEIINSAQFEGFNEHGQILISYGDGGSETIQCKDKSIESIRDTLNKWYNIKLNCVNESKLVDSFKGLTYNEVVNHLKYSHYRIRSYGVTFYARCSSSPSGVVSVWGCETKELSNYQSNNINQS